MPKEVLIESGSEDGGLPSSQSTPKRKHSEETTGSGNVYSILIGERRARSSLSNVKDSTQQAEVSFGQVVFADLDPAVVEKISSYVPPQMPTKSILPKMHSAWFYWWNDNVGAHLSKDAAVSRCIEDARRDGVLPENFHMHPKVSSTREYIRGRLKQINWMRIKKEMHGPMEWKGNK